MVDLGICFIASDGVGPAIGFTTTASSAWPSFFPASRSPEEMVKLGSLKSGLLTRELGVLKVVTVNRGAIIIKVCL